jgi:anti-sigma regulatory factor (Ser/Thr protein kinase)
MSTLTATVDLRPVPASVPVARHLVLDLLGAWRSPHDAGDAALLVTELVANVVDHVGGDETFALELDLSDGWLRIGVIDGSAVRPVARELEAGASRGRGLLLVESLADRWGVDDHHGGKRVWFELAPVHDAREDLAGLLAGLAGEPWGRTDEEEGGPSMSEAHGTEAAGEGLSDREMVESVAEQTDSASANAQNAGKDWDGDASATPEPTDGAAQG